MTDNQVPRPTESILATEETSEGKRRRQKFGGRRSVFAGALALFVMVCGAAAGFTFWGISVHNKMLSRQPSHSDLASVYGSGQTISDGKVEKANSTVPLDVSNPISYKDMMCTQINYIAKGNKIYASVDGKETQLVFKGVQWRGFESSDHFVTGLWDGARDGNTLYQIGKFLSDNNFNSVRLPLDIDSTFRDIAIKPNFNSNSQRALASASRYVDTIRLITEGLAQFKISVVLSFNTRSVVSDLNSTTKGVLSYGLRTGDIGWEDSRVHLADIQSAIKNLAAKLCDATHWNVVGIDIKDAPQGSQGTWGDGTNTDWLVAATALGNTVISECPQWLVFVQGLNGKSSFGSGTSKTNIDDWIGSTLNQVDTAPVKLSKANKVVYAPRFFSPSQSPKPYFYASSTGGDLLSAYTEYSDKANLQTSVWSAMDKMFGNVFSSTDAPVVFSEFGGLYKLLDLNPGKTSSNALEAIINRMITGDKVVSGGWWLSLNPDNNWAHPAPDSSTPNSTGLLDITWRAAVQDQLTATKLMDKMPGLDFLPCVKRN